MASLDPTITVDVPTIKLKVRMPPLYRFRIRMAAVLIGLAHHVAGSAVDIFIETEAADEA